MRSWQYLRFCLAHTFALGLWPQLAASKQTILSNLDASKQYVVTAENETGERGQDLPSELRRYPFAPGILHELQVSFIVSP